MKVDDQETRRTRERERNGKECITKWAGKAGRGNGKKGYELQEWTEEKGREKTGTTHNKGTEQEK